MSITLDPIGKISRSTCEFECPAFVAVGLAPVEVAEDRPVVEAPCMETTGDGDKLAVTGPVEGALPVGVAGALLVTANNPFPIVLRLAHDDDDGTGCAGGVTGWPWKNVEAP